VLVQREVIKSWTGVSLLLLFYIIGSIPLYITIKSWSTKNNLWRINPENKDSYRLKEDPNYNHYDLDDSWWISGIIVSGLILAICVIVTVVCGSDLILGILNPEYGAIKEIMELLK